MGEVAVLQPHDCLPNHHRRRPHPPPSPLKNPQKVIPHQPRRKKTTPRPSPPPPTPSSNNLVMGQVKILRRGDHLPGSTPLPSGEGLLPLPTQVEVVQIRLPFAGSSRSEQVKGFYAGSAAFVASPPPSSVPLPGFFAKRGGEGSGLAACDSATSDLRRILRLD